MEAMETNAPYKFGGNVMNTGLIPNLPAEAAVEVPCMADKSGVVPDLRGKSAAPSAPRSTARTSTCSS